LRKIMLLLIVVLLFASACQKKDPYKIRQPESVIWNPATRSYLISNSGTGIILSLVDKYEFFVFNKYKLNSPKGMAIQGNTLYVADNERLIGLDLRTGKKKFRLDFPASSLLNDVETSPDGKVYVSDTKNNRIIIVNPRTRKAEYITDKKLFKPNGLHYAFINEQQLLYIVSFHPFAAIQALNLKSRKLITIPDTQVAMADGITRDEFGFWLVSSWADSTIYKFNPDFSERSRIQDTFRSPADIHYNLVNRELAIPHFETNLVSFVMQLDSTQTNALKPEK
jgi:sugar lactone lactonase YvrE